MVNKFMCNRKSPWQSLPNQIFTMANLPQERPFTMVCVTTPNDPTVSGLVQNKSKNKSKSMNPCVHMNHSIIDPA